MHYHLSIVAILSTLLLWTTTMVNRGVALQLPGESPAVREEEEDNNLRPISARLFGELEELARVVDIAYCVGTTGIQKPFLCASRCQDFNHFKLITTWSTGILLSDSCGYLAVDHSRHTPRIILAFRGTYSLTNMIIDLSTIPQKYVPYPPDDDDEGDNVDDEKDATGFLEQQQQPGNLPPSTPLDSSSSSSSSSDSKCLNCTVHAGFLYSWMETRKVILPHMKKLKKQYPNHRLTLVGHSLGGAVAALAALEFHHRGWNPQVTTFGEPRVGNDAWTKYIDARFNETLPDDDDVGGGTNFRRVTHVYDQVPLLPLQEWGYRMHAGEIFISKPTLPPSIADLHHCDGDADPRCIAGDRIFTSEEGRRRRMVWAEDLGRYEAQFLMTHRDYFHRLGLCVPGGDPSGRWPGPVVLDLMMMPEEI